MIKFSQHQIIIISRGIHMVTFAPGLFDTELWPISTRKSPGLLAKTVPNPSWLGNPDEYAAFAEHIVLNKMINGEVIRIDGALRMMP